VEKAVEAAGAEIHAAVGKDFPRSLPPFDIPIALERCNGKVALLRKMMLGFRDRFTGAASEMRGLIAAGRTAEAERLAHSLKGAAATLEARELANAAGDVEAALRSGQTRGARARWSPRWSGRCSLPSPPSIRWRATMKNGSSIVSKPFPALSRVPATRERGGGAATGADCRR
jgi:HPt (histidine-containing phosphotransfer) domain-containing protein